MQMIIYQLQMILAQLRFNCFAVNNGMLIFSEHNNRLLNYLQCKSFNSSDLLFQQNKAKIRKSSKLTVTS